MAPKLGIRNAPGIRPEPSLHSLLGHPVTLIDVLKQEQYELLKDFERHFSNPACLEQNWGSFLEYHPDALTALYGQPIAHVHREIYIAPKHRVDYLVKCDPSYGFDVLELKPHRSAVVNAEGSLTQAAQTAIRQVIGYRDKLYEPKSRAWLLARGFEFVSDVRVDLLGFKSQPGHSREMVQQKVHEHVLGKYGDARKVPRLTTWDELGAALEVLLPTLFSARPHVRRLIRRAITKATAGFSDRTQLWDNVRNQLKPSGVHECGDPVKQRLDDWQRWLYDTFDLLTKKQRRDWLADLCAVLTYEWPDDIFGAGRWNRLLIDATRTWRFGHRPEWGNNRFPPKVDASEAMRHRVQEKWKEYGF